MVLKADPVSYPPRGLSREEAARWVGLGTSKFDELVAAGRLPKPKRIDGRVVWDRLKVDAAFSELGEDEGNRIDALFARRAGG